MTTLLVCLWERTKAIRNHLDVWAARHQLRQYIRERDRALAKDCHSPLAGVWCDLVNAQRRYLEACEVAHRAANKEENCGSS